MVLKNDNTLWKTEAIQQHQKKYEYYHSYTAHIINIFIKH